MIETMTPQKTVRGNLEGSTVKMGIQAEYMGHVMGMLAGMYQDKWKAIVREYACNARDAMVAAGRAGHPIEITLPGNLSQFYTIKDTGIGMDADDIERTYSQYGASTKRATNTQVGKFGIGSKAALAYADQFTLVGTKNGRRIQVAIARTSDGGGNMTIVGPREGTPTDQPNGVEIVVPVVKGEDIARFEERARVFFSYWEPGTVLVNGEAPSSFMEDALEIPGHDMWVVKKERTGGNDSVVIMGNVPYPCNIAHGLGYDCQLVARVPIGAVDVPPAREGLLEDDPTTTATLAQLAADFKEASKNAVQAKIDGAPTKHEAIKAREQWAKTLSTGQHVYTWRGEEMPVRIRAKSAESCGAHGKDTRLGEDLFEVGCKKCVPVEPSMLSCDVYARHWSDFTDHRDLGITRLDPELHTGYGSGSTWVIVEGYDRSQKPTPTVKKKLLQYKEDNGLDFSAALFWRDSHKHNEDALTWIAPVKRIQWADVWATKLPRAHTQTANGKPTGSYPVAEPPAAGWNYEPSWHGSHWTKLGKVLSGVEWSDVPADEIPARPFYTESKEAAASLAAGLNAPVVYLTAQRKDKFLREQAGARPARDELRRRRARFIKQLSEDDALLLRRSLETYGYRNYDNRFSDWAALEGHGVMDPDVSRLVELGKKNIKALCEKFELLGGSKHELEEKTVPNPTDKYPLLGDIKKHPEHAALYINAVYAAQAKGV